MQQLNVISPFWFSIFMVVCIGFVMLFDTFQRAFDEDGALYEVEFRNMSSKSHVAIRLISGLMILFCLFQLASGQLYSDENRHLVFLPVLFIVLYVRTYSREQNFTSLYFKSGFLKFGFAKYKYDDIHIIQELGKVEIRESSTNKVISSIPTKYFNSADFVDFIEINSFQDQLKYTLKKN